MVVSLLNTGQRLMGRSFRVFLHPKASLLAAAHAQGFMLTATGQNVAWEFAALRRAN
jgi:hypothetical protein